jgi:hypothetical protein
MILTILFSGLGFIKKAKLNLYGKTVPEIIQLARHIVTCMTANPDFTAPNPSLLAITAMTDNLEAAYEESQDGSHTKKALMQQLENILKHNLAYLEAYVTNTAMGDEQVILGSGMEVGKTPEHAGVLPAPADVRISNGNNEGEVMVRFDKVEHAASYEIQYYEANDNQQGENTPAITLGMNLDDIPWQHIDVSTKTKFIITGLMPGNRIIVRVAALNTEGLGTWSDPATMIIP